MILQVKTERELIDSVNRINAELIKCQDQNKALVKRIKFMQEQIDKKPNTVLKETITREIDRPVYTEIKTIELDKSVAPTLKKLSDRIAKAEGLSARVEAIERINPVVNQITKVETDKTLNQSIKKLSDRVAEVENNKPVASKTIKGLSGDDVTEIINKHVTIHYVNKLYKKGK